MAVVSPVCHDPDFDFVEGSSSYVYDSRSVQDDSEITNKIDNLFKYERFIKE